MQTAPSWQYLEYAECVPCKGVRLPKKVLSWVRHKTAFNGPAPRPGGQGSVKYPFIAVIRRSPLTRSDSHC